MLTFFFSDEMSSCALVFVQATVVFHFFFFFFEMSEQFFQFCYKTNELP